MAKMRSKVNLAFFFFFPYTYFGIGCLFFIENEEFLKD